MCVLTNLDAPLIEYTRRVESVRLWDALFLEVFALRLGAVLARELGKSGARTGICWRRPMLRSATAASVDSRESSRRKDRPPTRIELARRGGRTYDPTKLAGRAGNAWANIARIPRVTFAGGEISETALGARRHRPLPDLGREAGKLRRHEGGRR
jgi:hypothetical protein